MKAVTKSIIFTMIMGLLIAAAPDRSEAARYTRVRFKLTSSSKIAWGNLYINGRRRGRVSRSSYTTIRLRAGRSYRVAVRRAWNGQNWNRRKSVYVSGSTKTVFLHPTGRGGSSYNSDSGSRYTRVRFKLTSSSKIAWGRLYVNGSYKGRVSRSSYTTVRLRSGRSYRVSVRRAWNGQNWRRQKSVFVSGSSKTVFLHPMAR